MTNPPASPAATLKYLATCVLDELYALSMGESSADPASASRELAEAVLASVETAGDTERLDWIENAGIAWPVEKRSEFGGRWRAGPVYAPTLREAIDAACLPT